MINVKELGAKGDAQTDDTSAILSALNSVPLMGGVIYFPAGRYLLSATISIIGKSVGFIGDGRGVTCLEWTSNCDGICYHGSGSSAATLTTFSIEKLSLTTIESRGYGRNSTYPGMAKHTLQSSRQATNF